MSPMERRTQILEIVSAKRFVKMSELSSRLGVSDRTVRMDIADLMLSYPIDTRTGPYGGVYAMDGWHYGDRFLYESQVELLERLMEGLQPEDRETMKEILERFKKPRR